MSDPSASTLHMPQMRGNLTRVSEGKGIRKCPSQIERCLVIQALKHFTFLPKSPISLGLFSFSAFCSMSKMTTTYFTRWIRSEGIVTDATLTRKITLRLLTQNECLPICSHSPARCYLLKPTRWLSFVSVFQSFFSHLELMTALNAFLCIYRTNERTLIQTTKIP